jgi:hypothetical protein
LTTDITDGLVVLERISKTTKFHWVDLNSAEPIHGSKGDDSGTVSSPEQVDAAAIKTL